MSSLSSLDSDIYSQSEFVRENSLLKILPNYDKINLYSDAHLNEIKRIFIYCTEQKLFYDKFNHGLRLLSQYLKSYSLRFSKEDFVYFVKILYNVLLIKEIDVVVLINVLSELKSLIRLAKNKFSRDDLVLEWKPLYDIWVHYTFSSMSKNGMIFSAKTISDPLKEVIRFCSRYFECNATEEIWNLCCPFLFQPYPFNIEKYNGLKKLKLFLPFYYNNHEVFFRIIWPNLIKLFDYQTWMNGFENDYMLLLNRAAVTYVGLIDWTPYLDQLFTALLRSLKIKVAGVSKKTKYNSTKYYVDILVHAIYGEGNSIVIEKFQQLFQAISHLYHPSSQSQHSNKMLILLQDIASSLIHRYSMEYNYERPHPTKGFYSKEYFISTTHINQLVQVLLPSASLSIFTKNRSNFAYVLHSFHKLACLCPEIVVPHCLELFHDPSPESILQPQRSLSILAVITMFHIPLLNSADRYPEGKLAVFPLMRQLVSVININDLPKSYVAMMSFGNLANILWMEDVSDQATDDNLTDLEKKIAIATVQFEDLVLQFFDRIFEIIEIIFLDSGMVESHKTSEFRTDALIDIMIMTIPSIGPNISLQVLDKTIDFVFSHSFQSRGIQTFITSIFSCLLEKSDEMITHAHSKFIPKYIKYFKECVEDDCLVLGEQLDIKFVWLSNILPGFVKGNKMGLIKDDIFLILSTLDSIHIRESIKLFNILLSFILYSCRETYTSLDVIHKLKQRDFYRHSWSGLLTKQNLHELHEAGTFQLCYTSPGQIQNDFVNELIDRFIEPSIEILDHFTQLTLLSCTQSQPKFSHLKLKSVCYRLMSISNYIGEEMLLNTNQQLHQFPTNDHKTPTQFHTPLEYLQFRTIVNRPPNQKMLNLLIKIRTSIINAIKALSTFIHQPNHNIAYLPVTITDLEYLFNLFYKSFDISSASASGQNKSFLDRRFDSFNDPMKKKRCNSPLNWIMMFDWLYYDCCHENKLPITADVTEIIDLILPLVLISNSTIQRSAIDLLNNLCQHYIHYEDYIIESCLNVVLSQSSTSQGISEDAHNGIAQLLIKIYKGHQEANENMNFVYKLSAIFVSLCKSQHIEQRSNNNYTNKLFKCLMQYLNTFQAIPLNIDKKQVDLFNEIATKLREITIIQSEQFGCLIGSKSTNQNEVIINKRCQLYYWCVEHCLSVFLQTNTIESMNQDLFTYGLIDCCLKSTATWQNTLQMSLVLPFNPEIEIPVKFVELFLITLFSPSKELSSQACNQINIVTWLLRGKVENEIKRRQEMPCLNSYEEYPMLCLENAGPRNDNRFLVIEKDTDYWTLSDHARPVNMLFGYLGWPEEIKVRPWQYIYDTEKYLDNKPMDTDKTILRGDNGASWRLLCKVFESDKFHDQLRDFLLDLVSQFLSQEDVRNNAAGTTAAIGAGSRNNEMSGLLAGLSSGIGSTLSVGTFSIENLICSILVCVGPAKILDKILNTYDQLLSSDGPNKMYCHKLASKMVFGILVSIKFWPLTNQQYFFKTQLLELFDKYLEKACKTEMNGLSQHLMSVISTTSCIDIRQYIPLYHHIFNKLNTEHMPHRQIACLNFLQSFMKMCSWCLGTSIAIDIVELWKRFVINSHDKVRREAGKLMKDFILYQTLSNDFFFSKDNAQAADQVTRLKRFPDEIKQMFAIQTELVLREKDLSPSFITINSMKMTNLDETAIKMKLNVHGANRDVVVVLNNNDDDDEDVDDEIIGGDDDEVGSVLSAASSMTVSEITGDGLSRSPTIDSPSGFVGSTTGGAGGGGLTNDDDDSLINNVGADKIVAVMIMYLSEVIQRYSDCMDPKHLELFLIVMDMIPIRDKLALYSQLRQCALSVSNVVISTNTIDNFPVHLFGQRAISPEPIFDFLRSTTQHKSWRVRLVASKMMQFMSFYNLFVISRQKYLQPMVSLVFNLLVDKQVEVRKESCNILSGLIQCGVYKVDKNFISEMRRRIKLIEKKNNAKCDSKDIVTAHSGVLGLCAFIQAHPFDIPTHLPEALVVLCQSINRTEPLAGTIRDTLARFKKSHQETWHIEREHFTEDQLCALTDVLVSPSYYA